MGELTTEQLLNLPSIPYLDRLPKLPDGTPDLRLLPVIGPLVTSTGKGLALNLQPVKYESPMTWLEDHQTYVILGAGVLLLLAVMRGRR